MTIEYILRVLSPHYQAALLAILVSLILCLLFWPDTERLPTDDYLAILSYTTWKEEAQIYEEILKIHPMLTLNAHNRTLLRLYGKDKVERYISTPCEIEEVESPNKFNRSYVDHIEPFSTVVAILYKKKPEQGGRRKYSSIILTELLQ
jgi:hypothetical protein